MKSIAFAAMLLLLSMSAFAIGGAEVKASILRYEPTPAEQGNTVDIWVQLLNAGTKADRVSIKFDPEFPFTLPEGQEQEIDVGVIAATEAKVVKFTVYVDPTAPNGDRDIKFLYKYSSADEWVYLETPIAIETQNAALVIDDYSVEPQLVTPGQSATVKMKLTNVGKIDIKNLDVSLDLNDSTFSTIGSGTKKRINSVPSGKSAVVSFTLASDTSTQVKLYSIPVELSFQDERNKEYTDTAKISLTVNAQPELSLSVDSTDFESSTKPGTVTLKVVNKGVVNVKYLSVTLAQTGDYEILSPSNEEYVGNLDNDDFETVDFVIKPLAENPRLAVNVQFKDPYNVDFTQSYTLPFRIITDKDLGKSSSPIGTIVVLVLIAAGGIYWYRKRKKKR